MSRGPHDIGGMPAGKIDTTDRGTRAWEKQTAALLRVVTTRGIMRLDELRRAIEELGDAYYYLSYFERVAVALRNVLIEKRVITETDLESKMAEVRARLDAR